MSDWETIKVKNLDAFVAAMERAESKGYLPDAIKEAWDDFMVDADDHECHAAAESSNAQAGYGAVAYLYEHATYPNDYVRYVSFERTGHDKDYVCCPLGYLGAATNQRDARDAARYRWWVQFVFRAGSDGYPTCTYLADVEDPADITFAIDAELIKQSEGRKVD